MSAKFQICATLVLSSMSGSCGTSDLMRTSELMGPKSGIFVPYVLPEGMAHIRVWRDQDAFLGVEFLPEVYRPDPQHRYILEYDHSTFSDDTIQVAVTPEGYLQTISARSQDQTGEVIRKIVELATEVGKAFVPTKGAQGLRPFDEKLAFDPTDEGELAYVREFLGGFDVVIDDLTAERMTGPIRGDGSADTCRKGACFRPALPYKLIFRYKNRGEEQSRVKSAIILLPNEAPVMSIDISRYAFVNAKSTVTFKDGMLAQIDLDKPSEAVGFISVPVDVAKAIVGIPSALLAFRIKSTRDDAALLDSQTELIRAQMALSEQQRALLAAQTEALMNPNENRIRYDD